MSSVEACVTCEEAIRHAPVYFDGKPFCCVGCVAGGPCLCTYSEAAPAPRPAVQPQATPRAQTPPLPAPEVPVSAMPPPRAEPQKQPPLSIPSAAPPVPQPAVAAAERVAAPPVPTAPAAPAAAAPTPGLDASRAPIPFRRPGTRAVVLHARGFRAQPELLHFAALVERATAFSEVSLTRVTTTEAWFSLRATSPEAVAETVANFEGYTVATMVDQNLVEVDVHGGAPSVVPTGPAPEGETLLPPRPRFRVFRPKGDTEPAPARPAQQAQPAQPATPATPPTWEATPAPAAPARAPQPAPATPAADDRRSREPAAPVAPPPAAQPVAPPPAAARVPAAPPAAPPVAGTTSPAPAPRPVEAPRPAAPAPAPAAEQPREQPRRAERAAAPERDEDDEIVTPEVRPGGAVATVEHLTLVVYPFHSFAALNDFQGAVRQLHGVTNTRVRRFYRGTLHLAVDYEDMIPLGERIRDLKGFDFEVASESRSEIELVLEDSGSLVASGDK